MMFPLIVEMPLTLYASVPLSGKKEMSKSEAVKPSFSWQGLSEKDWMILVAETYGIVVAASRPSDVDIDGKRMM